MKSSSPQLFAGSGFTLIELLITIGIIGVLAAIVIIAINPKKQIEDAYDAERRIEVNVVLNAVYQFQIGKGRWPQGNDDEPVIPEGEGDRKDICQLSDFFDCTLASKVFLYELVQYDYLNALPQDPKNTDIEGTGYEIWIGEDDRIYVGAPNFRNGEGLTISK